MTGARPAISVLYAVMTRRLHLLGFGLLLAGPLASCAGASDRGRLLYGEGRYVEAAELFEHSEAQLSHYDRGDRTRYGLYRAMTLLRLGDFDGCARWLALAESSESTYPGTLEPRELMAMRRARFELNEARAKVLGAPHPLDDAVAKSQTASPDVAEPNDRSDDAPSSLESEQGDHNP